MAHRDSLKSLLKINKIYEEMTGTFPAERALEILRLVRSSLMIASLWDLDKLPTLSYPEITIYFSDLNNLTYNIMTITMIAGKYPRANIFTLSRFDDLSRITTTTTFKRIKEIRDGYCGSFVKSVLIRSIMEPDNNTYSMDKSQIIEMINEFFIKK